MSGASQRVTLITGASSTIGEAIAVRLSRKRGLILSGRNEAKLSAVRAACSSPDSHTLWCYDLGAIEALQESLEDFLRAQGIPVTAFVHCAGVPSISAARSVSYGMLKQVLDVNFASAALIAASLVKKRANGDALRGVVFVSSIFSRLGVKGQSLYCATKAALDGLMRALAVELAPRIRVNSVLPGAVPSPMAAAALSNDRILSLLQKNYPLGLGTPDAIAAAVDFLLSEDAAWITGQELVVDGGRIINHPFE
jgi:NAD(P)-dependent dehydrogenase (short-subunit alcohol dehydrogenase family)